MDAAALRAQFPVFERIAYLNAGTCGPIPAAALRAAADVALAAAEQGRATAYYALLHDRVDELRTLYARAVGAAPADVAVTTATTDGLIRVLSGMGLRAGDEILTAPDEHPGLLAPLAAARRNLGVTIRTAPFAQLAEAVEPQTKLVACSHVSWVTGSLAPAALAEVGRDIPVLLDGAQGAGAIPIDLEALGCAFYAAAGQKWLCGPVGTGLLWVSPAWQERLAPIGPAFPNLEDPHDPLGSPLFKDARAQDAIAISVETLAAAVTAGSVLAQAGWDDVHARAAGLAEDLAGRLRAAGRTVAPRDRTTLVSWEDPDPEAAVARAAQDGIVIRNLPGTPYVRASTGAWNDESDLERLLASVGAAG